MKRHPLDPFSLVAGILVSGVAIVALAGPWRLEIGAWAWPSLLILGGVAVLALALAGSRRQDTAGVDPTTADGELDPERAHALSAAYAELDVDVSPVDVVDDDPGRA